MKDIFDIMDETNKPVQAFINACNAVINSKFILAERAVSELLRTIASGRVLYDTIKSCTEDFDFSAHLKKAKRQVNGRSLIKIDNQPRKVQIAFVFCLLYSFDIKKTDMHKFIHTYYEGDNINAEYASFTKDLIEPFSKNVQAAINGEPDNFIRQVGRKREKNEVRNLQIFKDNSGVGESLSSELLDEFSDLSSKEVDIYREKIDYRFGEVDDDRYLDDLQAETLTCVCREIISIISIDKAIEKKEKEEILIICEAFEKSLDFGGIDSVKIMYIALKNTLKACTIARALTTQLESLVSYATEYDI